MGVTVALTSCCSRSAEPAHGCLEEPRVGGGGQLLRREPRQEPVGAVRLSAGALSRPRPMPGSVPGGGGGRKKKIKRQEKEGETASYKPQTHTPTEFIFLFNRRGERSSPAAPVGMGRRRRAAAVPCRQPGGTLAGAHRSRAEESCLAAGSVGPRRGAVGRALRRAGRRWSLVSWFSFLFFYCFGICDSREARTAAGRALANELLLPRD